MKIRLLTSVASISGVYGRGAVVDFPDEEAARYVKAGLAIKEGEQPTEKAIPKKVKEEKAII